jgi:hypothetical protein
MDLFFENLWLHNEEEDIDLKKMILTESDKIIEK